MAGYKIGSSRNQCVHMFSGLNDLFENAICDKDKLVKLLEIVNVVEKNIETISVCFQDIVCILHKEFFINVAHFAMPFEFLDRGHFQYEKDDFCIYLEKTEIVLMFFKWMLQAHCDIPLENSPFDGCIIYLTIAISSNFSHNIWTTDTVHTLSRSVLTNLLLIYHVETLSELLLLDRRSKQKCSMTSKYTFFCEYLNVVKTRLTKERWNANPTYMESFYVVLTHITFPYVSEYLDALLPPSLMLTDSHCAEHQVRGINALHHIAMNVSNDILRW